MTDPDTSRAPQPKFEEVAIDGATPAERISGGARWVVVITTLLSLVLGRNPLRGACPCCISLPSV